MNERFKASFTDAFKTTLSLSVIVLYELMRNTPITSPFVHHTDERTDSSDSISGCSCAVERLFLDDWLSSVAWCIESNASIFVHSPSILSTSGEITRASREKAVLDTKGRPIVLTTEFLAQIPVVLSSALLSFRPLGFNFLNHIQIRLNTSSRLLSDPMMTGASYSSPRYSLIAFATRPPRHFFTIASDLNANASLLTLPRVTV